MKWSEMNTVQRKLLLALAASQPAAKLALQTARAVDHDAHRKGRAELIALCDAQVSFAERGALASKCKDGKARGTGELNRKHVTAMPMQFYRAGGTC